MHLDCSNHAQCTCDMPTATYWWTPTCQRLVMDSDVSTPTEGHRRVNAYWRTSMCQCIHFLIPSTKLLHRFHPHNSQLICHGKLSRKLACMEDISMHSWPLHLARHWYISVCIYTLYLSNLQIYTLIRLLKCLRQVFGEKATRDFNKITLPSSDPLHDFCTYILTQAVQLTTRPLGFKMHIRSGKMPVW